MLPFSDHPFLTRRRFFEAGGALSPDAESYVERQADHELFRSLLAGELCYVLTARQMGKSSLMVRTAQRLRAVGVRVVLLDVAAQGQRVTPEQWYRGLLEVIGENLGLEEELASHWRATATLAPIQRWVSALERVVLPRLPSLTTGSMPGLVICLDEIDALRNLPFSGDELLLAIRHCQERRSEQPQWGKLTFCLLGVASPAELVGSPQITPFNLGHRVELCDFTLAEAQPLTAGLTRNGPVDPTAKQGLLSRIFYWTAGHPYLTQRVCEECAARLAAGERPCRSLVDTICKSLFFISGDRPQDSNLLFVRTLLIHPESSGEARGEVSLLPLYAQVLARKSIPEGDADLLVERLRLAGVVRLHRAKLVPRNRIYQRVFNRAWVARHLPGAELRRLRAAFRLGALRAGLIVGAVVMMLTGLTLEARNQAAKARSAVRKWESQSQQLRAANKSLKNLQFAWEREAQNARQKAVLAKRSAKRAKDATHQALVAKRKVQQALSFQRKAAQRAVVSEQHSLEIARTLQIAEVEDRFRDGSNPLLALPSLAQLANRSRNTPENAVFRSALGSLLGRAGSCVWRRTLTSLTQRLVPSPDGHLVAALRSDHTLELLDADNGTPIGRLLQQKGGIDGAEFSPDGRFLLTTGTGPAVLRDAGSGRPLRASPEGISFTTPVLFSPDGTRVVAVGGRGKVGIWNPQTMQPVAAPLTISADAVWQLAGLQNDGTFYACDSTNDLARWNWQSRSRSVRFERRAVYWFASRGPGQPLAVLLGHGLLFLAHPDTGASLAELGTLSLVRIQLTPDGRRLMAVGTDGSVRQWNAQTGEDLGTETFLPGRPRCAALVGNGERIIVGAPDGELSCWRLRSRKPGHRTLTYRPFNGVVVDRAGKWLAVNRTRGAIQLSPTVGKGAERRIEFASDLYPKALAPDGSLLTCTHPNSTWSLWSQPQGRWLCQGTPLTQPGQTATFSPDSDFIAFGLSEGGCVYRIDRAGPPVLVSSGAHQIDRLLYSTAAKGIFLHVSPEGLLFCERSASRWSWRWRAVTGLRWAVLAPNGSWYATLESSGAVLREARTDRRIGRTLTMEATVTRGAASADSRLLAVATEDGTVGIWDIDSQTLIREVRIKGRVAHLAFDPAANQLAITAEDRSIRVWDLRSGASVSAPIWSPVVGEQLLFPSPNRLLVTGADGAAEFQLTRDTRNMRSITQQISGLLEPGKSVAKPTAPPSVNRPAAIASSRTTSQPLPFVARARR